MTHPRGKLVWFFCIAALAAGLMTAANEDAPAQTTLSFLLSGTVTDQNGEVAAGLSVGVGNQRFVTRADGTYSIVLLALSDIDRIKVDDVLDITVIDGADTVGGRSYTVTTADVTSSPPGATVDIQLSGLEALVSEDTLPADGVSTSDITVNIVENGAPVTGDTVTITPDHGTVGDVVDNGDGTYTTTYTAPDRPLTDPVTDSITITSDTTGDSTTVTVTLEPVPTLISVTATPSSYVAGSGVAGMVNVNVSRGGEPVTDAEISISASRADGAADAGTVGDVTDNGDGSYSAPYAPSNTAGRVMLSATDAVSGESGSATVTVNAGAPAALAISVNPMDVSSNGNAMISVTVTDASGNGVGGLAPAGSAGSGSVGDFTENAAMGSYTAAYTAPMVEAEGTDIVTVNVGDLTGVATVNLTPEPPMMVSILVVNGTINKADGTGSVPGVNVAVTVNDKDAVSTTSDENGSYSVTLVSPGGNAASTGDAVSVVVTDANGVERGSNGIVLTNEHLGDGDSSVVTVDVTTDIGATTSALVVTGTVFREASEIAIDDVFDIVVTNSTNGMQVSGTTDGDGMYELTLFSVSAPVAETGDMFTVTAARDGGQVGAATHTITSAEVDGGRVSINIDTAIKASTSALVVAGTVYHEDGTIEMGAGLSVTVSSASRGLESMGTTDASGMYDVTFFSSSGPVGETGDMLTVTVMQDGAQIGTADYALTSADVDAQRATVDVSTIAVASTSSLVVTGQVFFLESQIPVGANIPVHVANADSGMEGNAMTDADGMYSVTFFSPTDPVAETGDALNVTVMHGDETAASVTHNVMASEIDAQRAVVDVPTSIKAESSVFNVTGTVYLEDGVSPAPPGLTVEVTNVNQGVADDGWTTADGTYSVTIVSASMAVARSADELTLDVRVMADSEVVGTTSHTLTTDEVVARRAVVDIISSHTADPSNVIVVAGTVSDPDGSPARAGVELEITLGSNPTRELNTNAGGGYLTTFFNPDAPVVNVHDTLTVVAVDRTAGSAANESMEVASHHVLARRITFDIALNADTIDPTAVAKSSQKFIQKTETVDFDGSESSDYIIPTVPGIITYLWDFGDGNTADTMNATHQYANSGAYIATLTVTDLVGNEDSMSLEIFVDTVRLGGLSLNTLHGRDVIDKVIRLAIARTDVGMSVGPDALLEMMRNDPATQYAVLDAINSILPPGMVPKQLLDAELPLIFEDYENIDLENFGNAVTARPGMGMGILGSKDGGFTRIVTGNKLDLYLATPRGDVGSVTFRLDGPDFDPLSEEGTRDAREAVAGMTMMHTFQLEEEQAILLLPSWPGLSEGAGAFASVTLRYSADELPPEYANLLSRGRQVPADTMAYASAPLSPVVINGEHVWSAEVGIEPGKIYYYFYEIELNTPVPLIIDDGQTTMVSRYAVPDPRNLQLEDRGVVEAVFTMEVQDAIAPFLNPIIEAVMAGQDLSTIDLEAMLTGENLLALIGAIGSAASGVVADIMTSLDPQMVSVFTVPMSTEEQSVWYTTVDLSDVADGMHTIDANAFDSNGVQIDNRPVYGKTFMLDRSAPAIETKVDNGQNSAMYMRDDGVLIATGLITPDPNQLASLMLSASTMDGTEDLSNFVYQIIRHSGDSTAQMANTWTTLIDPMGVPMLEGISLNTFNLFVATAFNDMLTLHSRAGMPAGMIHPYEMFIRGTNNNPELIVGEYGLRAVARDDVGNVSSYTSPVRVDIVAPDPDQAVITNIEIGDCNKDGDLDDPFESGPPSEDSTIFVNTQSVKLTVEIPNRTPHPLTGIVVQYKTAHGTAQWMDIATIDAPGVVEWNIDNFDSLFNSGGDPRLYVRAVATNALTITDPDPAAPIITLDDGVCPVQPEHVAVNVIPAGTNEETGGYCGIITVDGYTAARTIPDLASVRFDLMMPDGTSMTIGEATEGEVLSGLLAPDLIVVLGNLVSVIVDDGMGLSAPEATYRKWSITFNTASLVDSLDTPYVVSATMIGADGVEYAPIAGGTDDFLLHNGDVEVGTTIVEVADAYGALPGDAGFHQLGGILMDGLDTPVAKFTVDPAAADWRVAGINFIVNMRNADGSKGDAVDVSAVTTIEETVSVDMADMTKTSSDKIFTVKITDLSVLGAGGDYVVQALAYDSKAEPDVEAEDASLGTAVNVDNYTPPPNITINGRGEGMSLADFMAAHPLGYRIAQADDNVFPFAMNAPGVLMGDITVQIDGGTLASDLVMIDGTRHDFGIVASSSTTGEGDHPISGTITKRNGSASFDLVNLAIDRVAPVITVLSPTEDDEVSALPTIHAIYNDGEGYGIMVASDDPLDVPANVEIQITRLNPPDESGVPVDQNQLDDADDEVVYSPDDALAGGAYRTDVSVTDKWGNRSTASGEFTVAGTAPSVTILSPMADSVSTDGMPLISAVVTGSGALDVVTMIDGEAVDAQIDGKNLSYTPAEPLAEGDHTVTIQATDPDGKMTDASVTFSVEFDHSPPVVTQVSPLGVIWGSTATLSVTAIDDQSGVASVSISLDGGDAVDGATRDVEGLALGQHSATATVTNGDGYSDTYSWTFTVALDEEPPAIGTGSPLGIVRSTTPTVSVGATDLTGIASIDIAVANSNGDAVAGDTAMSEDGTSAAFVPGDGLANGAYSVVAVVTDNSGNVASTSWSFTVEADYDTTNPSINTVSPTGIVRVDMPSVSVSASDVSDTGQEGLSGVASIEISVAASDGSAVDGSLEFDDEGMAIFMPGAALANGEYTASATVTDASGNSSSTSWSFTVEVIRDETSPVIGSTSPQGISRSAMPQISVSATDERSGIASIEIALMNSAGDAVDGSTEMGDGSAVFTPGAALANDNYTASTVVTDNSGNTSTASWSFVVEVIMDIAEPVIGVTSPSGIVRVDMPTITASATDAMSGVGNIEISVAASDGSGVGGSSEFDGGTMARFNLGAALANDTYTATAVVTDNAGNETTGSWSFTVEVVMDEMSPIINATSPQGTIRSDMPRVDVSATDDMSGIGSFAIRVVRSDFAQVAGEVVFEGGTKASFRPANALRNDTYSVAVDVTDKAGNVTNASWSFTVQVDTTPPVISANSPLGIVRDEMPRVSVSATDDESGIENIEIRVLDSAFQRIGGRTVFQGGTTAAFSPDRALSNDTYTVGVRATDKAGNTADATWSFVLEADHTPPVVNSLSPQGIIRDDTPRISVSATDDISGIQNVEIRVRNSAFQRIAGTTTFQGGTVGSFSPASPMKNDTYTVGVKVTDKAGNTTDADWAFTIEVDKVPPTIAETGPHGIIRTSKPRITVSATDDMSGIENITIRVIDDAFGRVAGKTTFQGGTLASFSPAGNLDNGVYSVAVKATDKSGNVADAGWSFTVEVDEIPPSIAHTSPSGSVRPENPIISVAATDDLSGIANIVMSVRDSNQSAVPGRTVFEGGTLGTFVPSRSLDYGTHYVSVRVSDKAGNVANATYSFTVESADGLAVLNARNFPNPFAGATKIAFTLTRSSEVSIEIFDITMRPVWHMSPRTIEATKEHVIGWDGTTSGGEKLARGVYFCQIMVHDSLNPQYAILKMAIK